MLALSVLASLAVWTVLPWAVLGWSPTVVVSDSMRPSVRTGDVVLLHHADPDSLGPGSVVVYDDPRLGRVLHRVVQRSPDGFYLFKGDANPTPDSAPVPPAQIRGAAVLLIPWIGAPSVWLARGDLFALAGVGAVLLTCLRLVPYAFDPSYDPWAGGGQVLPAQVLLTPDEAEIDPAQEAHLLPPALGAVVLARLGEQTTATRRRHADLAQALS